jgi:hypothetical protein
MPTEYAEVMPWEGPHDREHLLDLRQFETVRKAYGAGDPDVLFKGRPWTGAPWPGAGKMKDQSHINRELIHAALSKPPELEDVDPRPLRATQPNILREHVNYYMDRSGAYDLTGRTSRDQHNVGNMFPTIYVRPDDKWDILSGHHRATAALLKGEALRARVIRQPD